MNVFLDLEETVIESWYNPVFLPAKIKTVRENIKLAIEIYGPIKSLNIFSFAIIDEKDLNHFQTFLQSDIEKIFQQPVSNVFIFSEENAFALAKKAGICVLPNDKISDVFLKNQKDELFELYALHHFPNSVNILFDDVVPHSKKEFSNSNILTTDSKTTVVTVKV